MGTTPIYQTWRDRIDSGRMTKSQCQRFAAGVAVIAAGGTDHRTNLTAQEARDLEIRLAARPVLLTEEHTAQGLRWLRSRAAASLNLEPELLEQFSHFSFDGDAFIDDNGYRMFGVPVWTIHTRGGRRVKYYARPWQGGGENAAWEITREEMAR